MTTPITSNIITDINNHLEICKIKSTYCPSKISDYIDDLQSFCYQLSTLINRSKNYVFNCENEINFVYYETLKKKVALLLEQKFLFEAELRQSGVTINSELEEFYNDVAFELGEFYDANKLSNNKKQSDDFNSFVSLAESKLSNINLDKQKPKNNDLHPPFDPNLWNEKCYDIFKYLYDNYYNNTTKRKLTNIWFFLKKFDLEKYPFFATKDDYKDFIQKNYNITLTNFDKAENKFEDKDLPSLKGHVINFEKH